MISRIELTNFMSHEHTVIELAPGLTVLVGPNNWGKSAIVAALQILCYNENSTYVVRHDERECSVKVETDDGHVIEWRRKNDSPRYVVDGESFDRLGGRVPEKVHQALRLPLVEWENQAFNVHFGLQKSPVFLLDQPGTHAAQFFASSSDAIRLVEMQRRHREKLSAAQREKARLEVESAALNRDLEILEPVVGLDVRLKQVERAYDELNSLTGRIQLAENDEGDLRAQSIRLSRCESRTTAFAILELPPVLAGTEPLAASIAAIERTRVGQEIAGSRAEMLVNLETPPVLAPTTSIEAFVRNLAGATAARGILDVKVGAMMSLLDPPALGDDSTLEQHVAQVFAVRQSVTRLERDRHLLALVAAPPQMTYCDALVDAVTELILTHRQFSANHERLQALQSLVGAPSLDNESLLSDSLSLLTQASRRVTRCNRMVARLSMLLPAPTMYNTSPLENSLKAMQVAAGCVAAAEDDLRKGEASHAAGVAELRLWAVEQGVCPTCGTRLDPERFVAQVAMATGGHSHA